MSNKRTTAGRKRALRDRRREGLATARESGSDEGFGIKLGTGRADRMQVTWSMDHDPFLALMGLGRLREYLSAFEVELVAKCRYQSGLSWDEIGWAVGVSGEALRKRLSVAVEALDPWQR